MLYEYAVEPACLKDWQTFRYLIEQFGVPRGRLVSQFPNGWAKLVYDSCSSFTFRQKQQLQIELDRLKARGMVRRSGAVYDGSKAWIENALAQFENGRPFHAMIVNSAAAPSDHVLVASEITQAMPRWAVSREIRVERTADALGDAAKGLLQIGERILFVDKMFQPASKRWQLMLARFVALALEGRKKSPVFEYHTKIDNGEYGKPPEQRTRDFQADCTRFLSSLLPQGVELKIVRWDQHPRGDFFHERCILTDKGGIRIDWGLDTGKRGETTLVSLLEEGIWKQAWENFQSGAATFSFIDEVTVVGAKVA